MTHVTFLAIRNWNRYQHYADRRPPWIKYYIELLYDDQMKTLPIATRLVWDQLLLLAAEYGNAIPNDPELIGKLIQVPKGKCREAIATLLKGRWLQEKQTKRGAINRASTPASPRARPRTRGEGERELEAPPTPPQGGNGSHPTLTKRELSKFTGCRYARGTHGASYIHDPLGQAKPPSDWPHPRPEPAEILQALANKPQPDDLSF